jgi:hypothetical protein
MMTMMRVAPTVDGEGTKAKRRRKTTEWESE